MNFAYPHLLFLLLLLPPFIVIIIINFREKRRLIGHFLDPAAKTKMVIRSKHDSDFFRSFFLILSLAFLILALARPQWGEKLEHMDVRGIRIQFLLDTSNSMLAEDLQPNRLETAKNLISRTIDTLRSDMVAQINFAGSAYVQCPFTNDYEAFKLLAESSTISPREEQGTDFSSAMNLAGKIGTDEKTSKSLIILITDGEDQEKKWQEPLTQLKKNGTVVFTVGIGLPEGAPIPVKDDSGKTTEWKKDRSGAIVNSKLDETTLIQIARESGGQYYRLTDTIGIDDFLQIIGSYERKVISQKIKSVKIDRFVYPLFLAILFLLMEMLITDKRVEWKKKYS